MSPVARKRTKICNNCPLNNGGVCDSDRQGKAVKSFIYRGEHRYWLNTYNGCNCPIKAKANSPTSQCPLGKW